MSAARKKHVSRPRSQAKSSPRPGRRWSRHVMETSDALDLESGVFGKDSPRQIALSLKRSAEASHRRKSEPYRSAMSMLTFFINRAGHKLPDGRRKILEEAKTELRKIFHRPLH
jgi:hypothetical protein